MSAGEFFGSFFDRFQRDHTTTLAASLAFYTAFSLAPLLILFVTLSAHLPMDVQQSFLKETKELVGADAAKAVSLIIDNAKERPDLSKISGLFGALTLLLSASIIFGQMRESLNLIFEATPETPKDESILLKVWHFLEDRLLSVGLALGFIFMMIVSLIASSLLTATFDSGASIWRNINILISFVFYIWVFTMVFRYLPAKRVQWKPAAKGGFITAFLFVIGKEAIGIYLGNSALGSAYGAAGSVIVLFVWVYYSALITFVGAHISSLLLLEEAHA